MSRLSVPPLATGRMWSTSQPSPSVFISPYLSRTINDPNASIHRTSGSLPSTIHAIRHTAWTVSDEKCRPLSCRLRQRPLTSGFFGLLVMGAEHHRALRLPLSSRCGKPFGRCAVPVPFVRRAYPEEWVGGVSGIGPHGATPRVMRKELSSGAGRTVGPLRSICEEAPIAD